MSPPRRAPETTTALRTSLVAHARRLIARGGASALTMRALAAEAGCAVGLPYKVFTDRHDLVAEICHEEFKRLADAGGELAARAGTSTVGANLVWFAEQLLQSPAVTLAHEVLADQHLAKIVTNRVHDSGTGPGAFEAVFANYLAAEKQAGRVASDIDETAFGFLLAGAIHNLIMSGDAWPRPTRRQLKQWLDAIAAAVAPRP
ncbi:MAG TPA: TetR/AcrR family transcriptional regulator [Acidimicrobiales bacterium]|nr:TetR/AcrR family transcriptional regulator [Acidimicrobiales bacterium]